MRYNDAPVRFESNAVAVPISVRLFLVGIASMLVVGGIGLGLVRWSFNDAPPTPPLREAADLAPLVSDLSTAFAAHGDWRFLPSTARARDAWLRSRVARVQALYPRADAARATLADRLALTDAHGHLLAGTPPAAPLVAIASIDRQRWTVPSRDGIAGYVTVAVPRNPDDALAIAFLMQRQRSLAVLAAIACILAAIAAAVVATSIRRPLHALVDGARRLGRGEFDTRVDAARTDELGELAQSFNDLGAHLQAAAQSRRQWIADTSHELRAPLAVLRAQVEAMQDGVRPMSREGLAAMDAQITSLQALVADLDQLARGDVGTLQLAPVRLDLWAVVRSTWDDYAERFRACGLDAQLVPPAHPAHGPGDAQRLRQVVRNLLENAARYTASGGEVTLHGSVDATHLHLHLDDSAPAVPQAALPRLGERFFRVDASRSRGHGGSGLGLALARQIVEAHRGRLEFAPSPLGGLRVSIQLPLESA